ncbi:class I SAM-dependent methyltransferase [Candidatus Gracilibacteria bacterium]|nr:class I SAM-dependent methyltransferase [Candidatus Gracilibacteria bacterium]
MNLDNLLIALKKRGEANDVPNISLTNAKFLRDLIKIKKVKNALEIGTANGFSAINFALELQKTNSKLTTIEFSLLSYNEALKNFKDFQVLDYINSIHGNAIEVIPTLNEKFDFVFIDGMKKRTKDFLELVWDKVEDGGIIIIDDVIKFEHKMIGLKDYLKDNQINYNIIPIDIDDGIIMIVK